METTTQIPIAIIGAACRLPGDASSVEGFWELLKKARTAHSPIPNDRWDADAWYHPDADRRGAMNVKSGFFLKEDVARFDAPFFVTTEKEAASMDPMKRLLLEVSWESLENAGIQVDRLKDSQTGCYVGCMTNDYEMLSTGDVLDLGTVAASANSEAMTANRVSWFYGLRGPSLTIDTACSSSLYALHLACQSLKLGETDMNLVAGVNLILHPNFMTQLSDMHMLSPDGISHTFDSRANGYARGEGIACLVVKRLADAVRDGDNIRAVIRGTGTNADGKTPSITMPSSDAQAELIRRTYAAAGLDPADTQYVEAHGTGTPLGDPIELSAIAATLGAGSSRGSTDGQQQQQQLQQPVYVGSVKGNVGHTEGCSGLAGVIKAVLCLEEGVLVPTAGVETVNPKLRLEEWRLALPREVMTWPSRGRRRVSVNSFGFGGANAHVILDDARYFLNESGLRGVHSTQPCPGGDSASDSGVSLGDDVDDSSAAGHGDGGHAGRQLLFVVSAKHQSSLEKLGARYGEWLDKKGVVPTPRLLGDLAHTLSQRRSHLELRSFATAGTVTELQSILSKGIPKGVRSAKLDGAVFVFTGQGAQWPGMGVELLQIQPCRESLTRTQNILKDLGCAFDMQAELAKPAAESSVDLPQYSQVLCTALQLSLVDALRDWGVRPRATVGHSSGEIAAAYAAGLISHEDAVRVAYVRGVCSASVERRGAMLAAGLSVEEAETYIGKLERESSAVIACVNSPSSVTLSGDEDAIDRLGELISADGRFARRLRVKTAYHSPHMAAVAQRYLDSIGKITPMPSSEQIAPMFSSVTGSVVADPAELGAEYWVKNMCSAVQFSAALGALITTSPNTGAKSLNARWGPILEIGPHGALQGPIKDIVQASPSRTAKDSPYLSILTRGKDAASTAVSTAGQLWALGLPVDVDRVNDDGNSSTPRFLSGIPSYPWNHERAYWHESASQRAIRFPPGPRTDLLGVASGLLDPAEPAWRNFLSVSENPWIADHMITGTVLYPGAGLLVMAIEGIAQLADKSKQIKGFRFRDVSFERGLVVPSRGGSSVETRLSMRKQSDDTYGFTILSIAPGASSWTRHCAGAVSLEYAAADKDDSVEAHNPNTPWALHTQTFANARAADDAVDIDVDTFYDGLEAVGMEYGPLFRAVVDLSALPGRFLAHGAVEVPDTAAVMPSRYELPPAAMHPAALDAVFHLLLAALGDGAVLPEAAVPFSVEDLFVAAAGPEGGQLTRPGDRFWGYARRTGVADERGATGELVVSDEKWSGPLIVGRGFVVRQVTSSSSVGTSRATDAGGSCAVVEWEKDVSFIRSIDTVLNEQDRQQVPQLFARWMDALCFKEADLDVLFLHDGKDSIVQELVSDVARRIGKPRGIRSCEIPTRSSGDEDHLPFKEGTSFGLVIAASDAFQALTSASVQELLKPGGILVQLERQGQSAGHTIIPEGQDLMLSQGADGSRLTISRRPLTSSPDLPTTVHILTRPGQQASSCIDQAVAGIKTALAAQGVQSKQVSFSDLQSLKDQHVISLVEAEEPWVFSWDEAEFELFKGLMRTAPRHLLWITRGGMLNDWSSGVEFAPTQGLLRVMRTEYPQIALPHLDVSSRLDFSSEQGVALLLDVWRETAARPDSKAKAVDMEYAEKHSAVFIPRAVAAGSFDAEVAIAEGHTPRPALGPLQFGIPLRLEVQDDLWVEDKAAQEPLNTGEVEVQVEFVGLSGCDASGSSSSPGKEAVGIIQRLGPDVKSVTAGQRVLLLSDGCLKTHARVQVDWCVPIPDSLTSSTAAALGARSLLAAQYALLHVARLEKDQRVLIHGAAGGFGQAAIQVAQAVGAEIWATVSSAEKRRLLVERYAIPESNIFDSKSSDFVVGINHATAGAGVHVVLDPWAAGPGRASLTCLADFGVYLDLSGENDNGRNSKPASPPPHRNASVVRVDLNQVMRARPSLIKPLLANIFDYASPSPVSVLPAAEAVQALSRLRQRSHHGKLVVSLEHGSSVRTIPRPPPAATLDPAGTYVLAGGLGALGLSLAETMLARGARHIVFLSRSGPDRHNDSLARLVASQPGCHLEAIKCDISDTEQVASAFSSLSATGRPIKGLVQAAMVLADSVFDNMSFSMWERATRPKVAGTLNLHAATRHLPLDFFVLLSSVTCVVGNAAQANYAAGNTLEDAVARLRPGAIALDVGLVSDSAHFTDPGSTATVAALKDKDAVDVDAYLAMYSHGWRGLQTTTRALATVIEAAMRGCTADGKPLPPQLVVGLGEDVPAAPGQWMMDRKFEHRVRGGLSDAGSSGNGDGGSGASLLAAGAAEAALKAARSARDAVAVVESTVKAQVADAMGIKMDEIDEEKALFDYGVDSLKAVEFRNHILRLLQSDLSVFELLGPTPLRKLAVKITRGSRFLDAEVAAEVAKDYTED